MPDKYGYETAYISVGDVALGRVSRDYRRQWQISALPWVITRRPGGLMYGVYGARWSDICSPYTTFDAATAAGVTWTQVVLGDASIDNTAMSLRTWQQVKTSFASWSAVNNGTRTWQLLLAGS